MATNLNEYCVHHINAFLKPHNWVQLSRVSQLWKLATSKNWKSISEIVYEGYLSENCKEPICQDAIPISAVELGKIVLFAAPHVKVLIVSAKTEESNCSHYIKIGPYRYKVEDFKIDYLLKLLAKKSTKLTEVHFYKSPQVELIRSFFQTNNIIKFTLHGCNSDWNEDILTHNIEELDLEFELAHVTSVSYQECFPNLKKLSLILEYSRYNENTRRLWSQILLHVHKLKSLDLTITQDMDDTDDLYILLSEDISNLSELEELTIAAHHFFTFDSPDLFFNRLYECCPKLRFLTIATYLGSADVEPWRKILTLPRLESFECTMWYGFPNIELPELEHLTKFEFTVVGQDPDCDGLLEAIKKMPSLEKLAINFRDNNDFFTHNFVRGVAEAATSVGKDVLIRDNRSSVHNKKLLITKLSYDKAATLVRQRGGLLELALNYQNEDRLFQDVTTFVLGVLNHHNVILLKSTD